MNTRSGGGGSEGEGEGSGESVSVWREAKRHERQVWGKGGWEQGGEGLDEGWEAGRHWWNPQQRRAQRPRACPSCPCLKEYKHGLVYLHNRNTETDTSQGLSSP